MKNYSFFTLLFLTFLVSGCGQTGPLYLPDALPPIHTEKTKPESVDDVKDQPLPEPSKSNITRPQ